MPNYPLLLKAEELLNSNRLPGNQQEKSKLSEPPPNKLYTWEGCRKQGPPLLFNLELSENDASWKRKKNAQLCTHDMPA